jgi:hypothetical protein
MSQISSFTSHTNKSYDFAYNQLRFIYDLPPEIMITDANTNATSNANANVDAYPNSDRLSSGSRSGGGSSSSKISSSSIKSMCTEKINSQHPGQYKSQGTNSVKTANRKILISESERKALTAKLAEARHLQSAPGCYRG